MESMTSAGRKEWRGEGEGEESGVPGAKDF